MTTGTSLRGDSWISLFIRLSLVVMLSGASDLWAQTAGSLSSVTVTLSPATSPAVGQPGVTQLNLTGNNFPSGTIPPSQVTLTLKPVTAGAGPTVSTLASVVTTLVGTTRRVTFQIPAAPTLAPNSGQAGSSLSVVITDPTSSLVSGNTQANFGAGISVGGAAAGSMGPVSVINPTTATAQLSIDAGAAAGLRTVTLQIGQQQTPLVDNFVVITAGPQPSLSAGINVLVPTPYRVSIQGQTAAGQAFASGNTSALTVNPAAKILSLNPASAGAGASLAVTLNTQYTDFVQGSTRANFGPGISVGGAPAGALGPVTVVSPTTATAQLTIDAGAAAGPRTVSVQTGVQQASLYQGFVVTAVTPNPILVSINPNTRQQGQTLTGVVITGQYTHFTSGSAVNLGPDIAAAVTAATVTSLTVNLAIGAGAATGVRNLTVTTDAEVVSLANAFTVTPGGTPVLLGANPNTGQQGQQSLSVTITGAYTHFAQATSRVSFGAGIMIGSVTVTDATHLAAVISIDPAAATGPRTATVTTGTEVVSLAKAFTVTAAEPVILTLNPNAGQQGQVSLSVAITAQNTHFVQGKTTVVFGSGVTVNAVTVADAVNLTASISIADSAAVGPRTLTVSTDGEVASLVDGFAVMPGVPMLLSVIPNEAHQGQQGVSVGLTGLHTNFVQGTTTAAFGPGITVVSLNVTSSTTATAQVNIDPAAQISLSDAFDRPDGPVGNGWRTWWGPSYDSSQISVVNGQLKTVGYNGYAGGVLRPLPVEFPVHFSFDFRTSSTSFQCGSATFNDGGWIISFNAASTASPAPVGPAQLTILHYSGQRNVIRQYWDGTKMATDAVPLEGPVGALRDYQAGVFAHIDGVVNTDLSVTLTIRYNDGRTPDPVNISLGPLADATNVPLGDNLRLSNANCSTGPHYFDNVKLAMRDVSVTTGPETVSLAESFAVRGGIPTLLQVSPNGAQQGQTNLSVTVVGEYTHFAQGASQVSLGAGITVGAVTVADATHLTANVSVAPGAALGPRTVTVTTGSEVATLANGFMVTVPTVVPAIASVNPNTGQQGQTLNGFIITGQFTHFTTSSTVDLGAGITPTVTAATATSLTVNLAIGAGAATGARNLTVTTGSEVVSLANGFTVTAMVNLTPTVNAGPDQTITFPSTAALRGTATDDGLPIGKLATAWSQVSAIGQAPSDWYQLSTQVTRPSGRYCHGTLYRPATNRLVTFGGYHYQNPADGLAPLPDDVWTLSNANGLDNAPSVWTQLLPPGTAGAPSPRICVGAAYDVANNRVIAFGGITLERVYYNDLWVLSEADGTAGTPKWQQLAPTGALPPTRGFHSGQPIYDASTNRLILVSGEAGYQVLGDVWVLTNANGLGGAPAWVQLTPTGTLPIIYEDSPHIAYDAKTNRLIALLLTKNSGQYQNEVWILSNANGIGGTPEWSRLSVSGAWPATRVKGTGVYDPTSNQLMIFGGLDPKEESELKPTYNVFDDTWLLTNANGVGGTSTWQKVNPVHAIPARRFAKGIYDELHNRVMIFGGQLELYATAINETWILTSIPRPPKASFADSTSLNTAVSFTTPSTYTLRLTANDTLLSSSDDLAITVGVENGPPSVWAGPDQSVTLPAGATLNGVATDDWLPLGSSLGIDWSVVSGPGAVTFTAPSQAKTTAAFTAPGVYVLRLTATDSQRTSTSNVTVTVSSGSVPTILSATPNSGQQGQTNLNVVITGLNTHFVQGTSVASFGAGITVISTTVTDGGHATANISIAATAATGPRTVTMTTGPEGASLANGFTVVGGPLVIQTSSLPDAIVGVPYNTLLAAAGGTGAYAWALGSGSGPLPSGLTLNANGTISGTPGALAASLAPGGAFAQPVLTASANPAEARPDGAPHHVPAQSALRNYAHLPLRFEPNEGQGGPPFDFLSRGIGYNLHLNSNGALLRLTKGHPAGESAQVQMKLVGSNPVSKGLGSEPLATRSNYLLGSDPAKWKSGIRNYSRVQYRDVYPGVDLVYYGKQSQLEYDFVVRPGADPSRIQWAFDGVDKISIDESGDLVLGIPGGEIRQHKPLVYQESDGGRRPVAGRYVLQAANRVGFELAEYDQQEPVVIDPVLSYSTYLGGSGTDGTNVTADPSGNIYIAGGTGSSGFLPSSPLQSGYGGGSWDAFIMKLAPDGSTVIYSTYLGGSGEDWGGGIAVDNAGNVYVAGFTYSTNFPVVNAVQPTNAGADDAWVAKLNSSGTALIFSTYLGGSGQDRSSGTGGMIGLDAAGNVYVGGMTASANFPTTAGAYQRTSGGGVDFFVSKLSPTGALLYSTFLGGSNNDLGTGLTVDPSGCAYASGTTLSPDFPTTPGAFKRMNSGSYDNAISKLDPTGSSLIYSTYLGGSGWDGQSKVAVDSLGNAYVTGWTNSDDFPVTPGAFQPAHAPKTGPFGPYVQGQDLFVTKLNSAGSALVYSTYLGGAGDEYALAVAVDELGNLYATGATFSTDFPVVKAFQPAYGGGQGDSFALRLNAAGSALEYSSYLGGNDFDEGLSVFVDAGGNTYWGGYTASTNFPTVNPLQASNGGSKGSWDGYVAVISGSQAQTSGFVVQVTDSGPPVQTATKNLSIRVVNPLAIVTNSLMDGVVGSPYSTTLGWSGGTKRPAWTLTAGAFPPGLTLSSSGVIAGSPTQAGTYAITVQAADAGSPQQTATKALSIRINQQSPALASVSPNAGLPGQSVQVTINGQFTHFVQGTTQASFGAGISVGGAANGAFGSINVTSATTAVAQLSIAAGAALGTRTVTLTTGSEVVSLANGFTVTTPPVGPTITSVNPTSGPQGGSGPVVITGQLTNFLQGTTQVSFGTGITVNSVTVSGPTQLTAQISVADDAPTGPHDVTVTTGAEVVVAAGGFTVNPGTPVITSVNPASGRQGATVSIAITGKFTHFVQDTSQANFGADISVNSLTVTSQTALTVQITIAPNAATGPRPITLTTGSEVVTLAGVFTVLPDIPVLTSVNPNTSQQGQTLTVTITGQFTHFAQGTSQVSFGQDITVNSVSVASATSLTANISVAANAALGPRTVSVTTGSEAATLVNGFSVGALPYIDSVNPGGGQLGQTLNVAVTGKFTNFAQGVTQVSLGAGITVNSVAVSSATSLTANVTIAANAALGPRDVVATSGSEIASFPGGFTVVSPPIGIVMINPASGAQGQTLSLTVQGQSTHFQQGTTTVSLGAGITVGAVTVADSAHLTANISIAPNAMAGLRTVTVTTGTEVASLADGFTVRAPVLISMAPGSAQIGQLVSVAITGRETAFQPGLTQANFGAGVSVSGAAAGDYGPVIVIDSTRITAQIGVSAGASVGPRLVTVRTGTEIVTFGVLLQVLGDYNATHSLADVVHLGDNFGDVRFIPPDPAGTSYRTKFRLASPPPSGTNPALLINQYQADNSVPEQRSFVSVNGTSIGFFTRNSYIQDLTGATSIPVLTDIFSLQPFDLSSTDNELLVQAGDVLIGPPDTFDDLDITNIRVSAAFLVTGPSVIASVTPDGGVQGQSNLAVTVAGQFTNFVQGSTAVSMGAGVSVNSVTVASPTSLTANVSIATNAATGPRTVTVTTGSEVATLLNGFTVQSATTNQSPVITINPTWSVTLPNRLLVTYTATDDGLPLGGVFTVTWSKFSGPGQVGFTNQTIGQNPDSVSVGFSDPGAYVLRITATDTQYTVFKDVTVTVTGSPVPGPSVSLSSPVEGQEITTFTDVIGTVDSQILDSWTLEYRMTEEPNFQPFATGTTTVSNAKLGVFDPTMLLNGITYIRLSARDLAGRTVTTTPVSVVITKNQKIGHFTVSFKDLEVPVAGIPIQLIRTYDTRALWPGDFGVGWTLDIRNVRVRDNGQMGLNWQATVSGGVLNRTYCVQPTKQHVVTVTLSDGTTYKFQPGLSPQCQLLVPLDQVSLNFTQVSGPPATLSLPGGNQVMVVASWPGSADLWDLGLTSPVDYERYIITLKDGQKLTVSRSAGMESLSDRNNNTLTITPAGITHSSGKGIAFIRDAQGRITKVTDPNGNTLQYTYGLVGDLEIFTDQTSAVSTCTYDSAHRLVKIQDPRGIEPIRNEYDASGRLIKNKDAFGNEINYTHDFANHQEIVTDRLSNQTINEYDADGNVVKVTDPLNNVTQRQYDARGNMTKEINALGKVRSFTYDSNDNRLTETDPLNNTTTYTYNSLNQVATITDAEGRVTTNTYDANGNLTETQDAAGNKTAYTYDSQGLQTSMKDPLGFVTQYGYNAFGHLLNQTDALNRVTSYTYDSNGNRKTEQRTRTTPSGPEVLLTQYIYDGAGRLTQTTYPDNSTTKTLYNSIGKQSETTDQLGRKTTYTYDAAGRLTETKFPDGTSEKSEYDAEGRRTKSIDRASRATVHAYDKLGRLQSTTFPDGAVTSTVYDAIGQVTQSQDARNNVTKYEYDDAGRRTKVSDALNNATSFTYDKVGNQKSMTDANGKTTQFEYDLLNRRTRTVYPDTTFDQVAYDALGRTTSKTDQASKVTQFTYDALGRLIKVVDALNQITQYTYDEVGNRLTQTDANSRATTFEYDKLGRRTKRTLPLGMSETMTYDAAGNLKTKTDFNGRTTAFDYDLANRLTKKTPDPFFGAAPITLGYTATGQRSQMVDASGTSTYQYDLRDRLSQKATPQGTLTYLYDQQGNLTSIRSSNPGGTSVDYTFDVLNRLSTVKDNRLASGTTTYLYDNAGNLQNYLYPNGVQHSYTYNGLNRLTNLAVAKGATGIASYAYTLGAAGNRTKVVEFGGRTVDYAYDALYRLTSETIAGGTVNGAIGYTYDGVGNRLTRTSSVTGVPNQTFTYDANDRLNTDTYDPSGNTTGSGGDAFAYDFENRLLTKNGPQVMMVYDGDGNRVAKTVGGVTTRYLVDDRNLTGYAQVLEEIVGGTVALVYTYGLNRISQSQASGTTFYVYDGHGNARLLTDATGAVGDRYDYDAFGNVLSQTGGTPNVYLYSGEQLDANLGFYYLRARYASPSGGRFMTADPWAGTSTDPSSLHKYVYGRNDPVNRADPSGRQFTLVDLALTLSINATIESVQAIYAGQLLRTLFDVNKIAYCCIDPAAKLQNVALNLIANGGPDWAFDLYNTASEAQAKGYQIIAKRMAQTYRNILESILNVDIDVKIPLIDKEIKRQINLADIAGLPDFSSDLKAFDDKLNQYTHSWADLLTGAVKVNECDVASFLSKYGGDYFDKVVSKLNGAFGEH